MAKYSYDDIYQIHAWRDNSTKLVLTKGEGLYDTSVSANTYVKTAKFQLRDEKGIIQIPSSTAATLALRKCDGSEELIYAFNNYSSDNSVLTNDRNKGIVTFAIKQTMTSVAGDIIGEIRLTTDTGIIKFYGINFYVYDCVSNNAIIQSQPFKDLEAVTQKVEALLPYADTSGNLITLDTLQTLIAGGGVHPSTSKAVYDFVTQYANANFEKYQTINSLSVLNSAFDGQTIYYGVSESNKKAIYFNVVGTTKLTQYRFCEDGTVSLRNNERASSSDAWSSSDWFNWKSIGITANINNYAITENKLDEDSVSTAKIQNGAVTYAKMDIDNPQALANAISEYSLYIAIGGNVPTSSSTNYPIPMIWYNSTNKVAYLIYNKRSMGSGSYGYDSHIIPRFTTQRTFNNPSGVDGEMIYSSSDHKLHLYDLVNNMWRTFVTEEITIAGLSLSESITIDDLMGAFEGKIVYQYEYEYNPPSATSNKYHCPAIWRNTTDDSTFLIYKRTGTSSYHYYMTRIPRFQVYTSSLSGTTMSGIAGQMAYSTVDKTLYTCDGSSWVANVTELRTIAGISLSSNITAEQLSAALSGYSLCWHESEYSPSVVTGEYSFPAIWHNTTNDTYFIVYDGELTSNNWSYSSYQIPKATSFFNQFDYHSGVVCEVAVVERTGEIFVCMGGTSWEQVITKTYLDAENYVHSHFHRGLSGTWRPTTSDEGTVGEMWWTVDEEGKYICYQLVNATGSAYYWKPLNENSTPQIHIGITDKPNIETGNDYELWYHKYDRYINKKNGKLWVCTLVEPDENMDWSYSWSLKGNLYNYSAVVDYTLQASSWNNNQITLSGQLVSMADGRTRVDVDFDESTYLQLCADGCGGLYVTTDNSGAQTEFVIHAINNPPTQNITVQLTLSQVIEW